jgi:hypothetical protein
MTTRVRADSGKQRSGSLVDALKTLAFARFQACTEIVPDLNHAALVSPAASLEKSFKKQLQSPVEVLEEVLVAEATVGEIAPPRPDAEPFAHFLKMLHVKRA